MLADKHRSGGDFLFLEITFQQSPQLVREKDGAALALVAHLRSARLDGLNGDEPQLGHPDAGGADGLDDQGQSLVFFSSVVVCRCNMENSGDGYVPVKCKAIF